MFRNFYLFFLCSTLLLLTACTTPVVYSGSLKDDLPHGEGTLTYPGGAAYEGEFRDGNREGFGRWEHPNGTSYEGQWLNDRYHGTGTLHIPGILTYKGDWEKGQRSGYGVQEWADGRLYEGEWHESRFHGFGLFTYPDGSTFEGDWYEGRKHGQGTSFNAETGETLTGRWEHNKFIYVPVSEVRLNISEATINLNDPPLELEALVLPADATKPQITWQVENPAIASIAADLINPLSVGETYITVTARADGVSTEFHLTVLPPPVPVTNVTIDLEWLNLEVGGDPLPIHYYIEPADADDRTVYWHSDNPGAVTVTDSGVVYPNEIGAAIITVQTADGGFTDAILVNVRRPLRSPTADGQ